MDYRAPWGFPSESLKVLWKPLGSIWDSKSEPGQFHKPNADLMTWKERSVLFIPEVLGFLGAPIGSRGVVWRALVVFSGPRRRGTSK